MASLQELIAQKEALEREIERTRNQDRINQLRAGDDGAAGSGP